MFYKDYFWIQLLHPQWVNVKVNVVFKIYEIVATPSKFENNSITPFM